MKLPRGFAFKGHTKRHVLELIYNLYGAKDAGRIYFLFMRDYMIALGFVQDPIDPCVFYYMHVMLLMYVDDFILIGPTNELIDEAILTMQDNADVEDKRDVCQYVGVLAERIDEFTIVLRQPHLIEAIIIDLAFRVPAHQATEPSPRV